MKKNRNTGKIQLIAKKIKGICKRKISITESLLVLFLITGGMAYSEPIKISSEKSNYKKQTIKNPVTKRISMNKKNIKTGEIIILNYTSTIEETRKSKVSFENMNNSIMNEMAKSKVSSVNEIIKLRVDNTTTVEDLIKNFNIEYKDNLKLVSIDRKKLAALGTPEIGKMALVASSLFYGLKEGFLFPENSFSNSKKNKSNNYKSDTLITPEVPVIPPESIIVENETRRDISGTGDSYEFSKKYDVREYGIAISARGESSKVVNNGELIINNNTGIGIQAIGNYSIAENIKNIQINKGTGMYSDTITGKIINKDSGLLTIKDGKGIWTENGALGLNKSTITGTGTGMALYASKGGKIVNDTNGSINGSFSTPIVATGENSEGINRGILKNDSEYSMIALDGGIVINEDGATILNSGTFGMGAKGINSVAINQSKLERAIKAIDGGKVVNNKEIITTHIYSMEAEGKDSLAINNSSVNLTKGMFASNGGEIINTKISSIVSLDEKSMLVNGKNSKGINNGTISSNSEYGMFAQDQGKVINEVDGIIINNGAFGMGATGKNSTAINKGTLSKEMEAKLGATIINEGSLTHTGIYAMQVTDKDSTAINNSSINLTKNMFASNGGHIINETISTISFSGDKAMIAQDKDSIALNKGNISNNGNFGMFAENNAVAINEGDISNTGNNAMFAQSGATIVNNSNLSNKNNYGMKVDGKDSEAINIGNIVTSGLYGMFASNSATVTNEISGVISNGKDFGMISESTGSNAINKGTIANNGEYGMFALGGGKALNINGATINNNGIYGMGAKGINSEAINQGTLGKSMKATEGGKVINNKEIITTHTYSMEAEGKDSTAINDSLFNLNKGMFSSNGGHITNEAISNITFLGNNGMLTRGKDSTALNKGIISNKGNFGMLTESDAVSINEGNISNIGNYGMSVNNKGKIINNGTISNTGQYGIRVESGAEATNNGIIQNTSNYGSHVSGAGSLFINNGTISNKGTAVYVDNQGKFINGEKGIINNPSGVSLHVTSQKTEAINNGIIITTVSDGVGVNYYASLINGVNGVIKGNTIRGVYAARGTFLNNGLISNTGDYGVYTETIGVSTNGATGIISNIGDYGMYSFNRSGASTSINQGTISNVGNHGMSIWGSTGKNGGLISNTGNYGMYVSGGTITNTPTGTVSNNKDYGMYSNNSSLVNQGLISNKGNYGIYVTGNNGTAINNGIISNTGLTKASAFAGAIVTNEKMGIINVSNDFGIGMEASGLGSRVVNKGTINLTGNNQIAMYAKNNASVLNDIDGIIDLSSSTNASAFKADTGGTIVNNGTILLNNTPIKSGISQETTPTRTKRSLIMAGSEKLLSNMMETQSTENTDSYIKENNNTLPKNSSPIYLGNDGSFINNGNFLVKGDFDSTDMGKNGKFILKGGTLEADTVRGNYYASGALTWGSPEVSRKDGKVIQSTEYSNKYNTYQMFKANNMYAQIKSNSSLFDSKLTEKDSNGYYGIKMYRKSFYDILDNNNFAKYLEDNYKDEGKTNERTDLYNSYKLISTNDSLNEVIKRTFGETIYPTLMEQNYKLAKLNNKSIKNEVFNKTVDQEVGDFNYIGYATSSNTENRKSDNFSENDMKYSSISLGIDKKLSTTTRVGILGTVGKTDISFRDESSRKGDVYQINMFSIYEASDIKGTANLYTGKIKGELNRKLSSSSIHEEMKTDTESNYYGLNLSFEKKYELNKFDFSPRFELNSMYMTEEKIKEKGKYGLDLNDTSGKSVDSGLGFIAKKDIFLSNNYKLIPELSAMYYRELGNPYKDRDAKLSSVSKDSVKLKKYDEGKDTAELNIGIGVKKGGLGVTLGINYEINNQDNYISPYVNIGYLF